MKNSISRLSFTFVLLIPFTLLLTPGANAQACITLATGLQSPLGITQTNQGNLVVAETGTGVANSGRLSLIDPSGARRTLIDGLPSARNDVNEPSGPAGVFMRGRTLFVAIGVGDTTVSGGGPGLTIPNPDPPASPLFSSVLALHFSAATEKSTSGFNISYADHQALAAGQPVAVYDSEGHKLTIQMIVNLPNSTPNPVPAQPLNARMSNPFDIVGVDDQLYVTDGGRDIVWQIDAATGAYSILTQFPQIPNPLFGIVPAGGPMLDAVPTGIRYFDGQLYVALFRGVPFPPGTSVIERVDPLTGAHTPFITGLKTAIDFLPLTSDGELDYLVLQHASAGPFFGSPGNLLRFDTPAALPASVANCFTRPTSMAYDRSSGIMYVTEYSGRLTAVTP